MTPRDIVDFWMDAGPDRWFSKDAAFDVLLSERHADTLAEARDGALDHWADTPEGVLALVIVLDQFSRNIHRGTPQAFAGDAKALALAQRALARGDHHALPAWQAMWLFMPLEHAEDIAMQRHCVALFEAVPELEDMVKWAREHFEIIARFGRFPHRNAILGRVSTPEEIAFLKEGGFSG